MNRIHAPNDFNEFANALLALGVIRQTYDVLVNSLYFYAPDNLMYHLPLSDIEEGSQLVIGDKLEIHKVKEAIENIDKGKLSVFEFHREIARAGIVYVSVFLNNKAIYYLSQNGEYYLEKY